MNVDMRKLLEGLGCVMSGRKSRGITSYTGPNGTIVRSCESESHRGVQVGSAACCASRNNEAMQIGVSFRRCLDASGARDLCRELSLAADIADAYNRERGE